MQEKLQKNINGNRKLGWTTGITQVCSRPSPPVAIAAIIAIVNNAALAVSFYAARRLTLRVVRMKFATGQRNCRA